METSERMRRIRSGNTKPEMVVRRLIHGMGYRYRLHGKALPGKPDVVFSRKRKVIFVHGCFWHHHEGCAKAQVPSSNQDFWLPKLQATVARDASHLSTLSGLGWEALVIWECELKNPERVREAIRGFLQ